jgi:hypothetical protein
VGWRFSTRGLGQIVATGQRGKLGFLLYCGTSVGLATSYIIFTNAEIFNQKNKFLEENIFVKKNEEYSGIFKNYLIFENESSKINNYSTDTCRNCPLYILQIFGDMLEPIV